MNAKNKHRTCAYCRKFKSSTVDHVPPKLLLQQPFPPNLLTVPCCGDCNQSFKADDEYTRTIIGVDVRASINAAAQYNLPAIIRSLQKPDARGFAEYIASQSSASAILGPDGNPMGQIIEPDRKRIDNTGAHIIRGLYFIEMNRPLPEHAILKVASKAGLTAGGPDMLTIAGVAHRLGPPEPSGGYGVQLRHCCRRERFVLAASALRFSFLGRHDRGKEFRWED